jgi:hypothetical protein
VETIFERNVSQLEPATLPIGITKSSYEKPWCSLQVMKCQFINNATSTNLEMNYHAIKNNNTKMDVVDGVPFDNIVKSRDGDELQFDRRRTEENNETWTTILSRRNDNLFIRKDVNVTRGFKNGVQLPSTVKVRLVRIDERSF